MADLIAREHQLNMLDAILEEAVQGQLQIVFVTGEAGIGKTVLITSFAERAKCKVPELIVVGSKCHCITGGQQEPYLPFAEALEAISAEKKASDTWNRLRRGMVELAPDWLQILPGVGDVVSAVVRTVQWGYGEFGTKDVGSDSSHLMIQYTNVLRLVAETAPLLLWVDDLHWCDSATLDLMSFIADHAWNSRVMLIAAYRPTDVTLRVQGQPHPLRRLVSKLNRHQQCVELAVPAFTRADMERFLAVGGHRLPGPAVESLWRHSGGNPFFLKEYVTLLHARRMLKWERGTFVLSKADAEVEIPSRVQDVIEQRLELIGRDLRQLLSYASAQGERFASHVLVQLLKVPELEVLEKLNLLERVHRLIRELEQRQLITKVGTEYQFIHALIQEVLYEDLSAGQRSLLHRTIALLLEDLYGEDAVRFASDLATHFEHGGETERAIHYHLRAFRNAMAVLALDDALSQAEAVRRLARQVGEDERTARWHIQALVRMAEVNLWRSDYDAALAACDEAEVLCHKGDFAEERARLLYWRAMILSKIGCLGDAVEVAKIALDVLGDTPSNRRLQGSLNVLLGRFYFLLPLVEIQHSLDAALATAEEHGLPEVRAKALMHKSYVAANRMDMPEEALRLVTEALAIAQDHDLLLDRFSCHWIAANVCRRLKRGEEALSHDRQATTIARRHGLPRSLHLALSSLAVSWCEVREDWKEGLRVIQEAVSVADQYGFPYHRTVLATWFHIAFGLGLWREAEQAQDRFRGRIDSSYPRSRGFYHMHQGHVACARGLYEEAVEEYQRALVVFDRHSPDERDCWAVQPFLGLALLEKGDLQRGVEILKGASNYWKNRHDSKFAQSLIGLARSEIAQGDPFGAVARLQEALRVVEGSCCESAVQDLGWSVAPHVSTELGWALLVAGEPDEALDHALIGYRRFKKRCHFLLGEAAFVLGQILMAQGRRGEAIVYLKEARSAWQPLGIAQHRSAWEAFMQKHGFS